MGLRASHAAFMPPAKRSPGLAITTHKTDRNDVLVNSAPDPRSRKKSDSGRTRYQYALSSGCTRFHKPKWQLFLSTDKQHQRKTGDRCGRPYRRCFFARPEALGSRGLVLLTAAATSGANTCDACSDAAQGEGSGFRDGSDRKERSRELGVANLGKIIPRGVIHRISGVIPNEIIDHCHIRAKRHCGSCER